MASNFIGLVQVVSLASAVWTSLKKVPFSQRFCVKSDWYLNKFWILRIDLETESG